MKYLVSGHQPALITHLKLAASGSILLLCALCTNVPIPHNFPKKKLYAYWYCIFSRYIVNTRALTTQSRRRDNSTRSSLFSVRTVPSTTATSLCLNSLRRLISLRASLCCWLGTSRSLHRVPTTPGIVHVHVILLNYNAVCY